MDAMKMLVSTALILILATPAMATEIVTGEAYSQGATSGRTVGVSVSGAPAESLFALLQSGLEPEIVAGATSYRGDNITCSASLVSGGKLANHSCRFSIDSLGEMKSDFEPESTRASWVRRGTGKSTFRALEFTKAIAIITLDGSVAQQLHAHMLEARAIQPIGGEYLALNGRNIMCHVEPAGDQNEKRHTCSFFVDQRGATEPNHFIEIVLPEAPAEPIDQPVSIMPVDRIDVIRELRQINSGVTLPFRPVR